MNTLRNYLLVFTMALMSVCFVACGNNTTTDNETTTATNQESSSENTTKGGNSGKVDNKNDGVIGDIGDDIEEGVDDIVGDDNDENTTDTTNIRIRQRTTIRQLQQRSRLYSFKRKQP